MPTYEIVAQKWQGFCDEFSKLHPGQIATVQIISPDLGAQEESKKLPFGGISFEAKGSQKGSIRLMLGMQAEDHVEHLIEDPLRIWLRTGGEGDSDAVEIEAADHSKTILQLQPAPALPH